MAEPHLSTRVQLAPGEGYVARTRSVVLFCRGGLSLDLIDAVTDAVTPLERTAELDGWLASRDLDGFEFAFIELGQVARLTIFGAVEVTTDDPSLRMITGTGSLSWIERRLPLGAGSLTVDINEKAYDPATNLTAGVVRAGGLRLTLGGPLHEGPIPLDDAPSSIERTPNQAGHSDGVGSAESGFRIPESPDPSDVSFSADHPEIGDARIGPGSLEDHPAEPWPPSGEQAESWSPQGEPAEPWPAQSEPWSPPSSPAEPWSPESEALPRTAYPPPDPGNLGQADIRPLIEAVICDSGHPSPPLSELCDVCGLPIGANEVVVVPRPSVGSLSFDDGSIVELDREVLIGRAPDPAPADDGRICCFQAPGEKVSRNHIEVRLRGWDVELVDVNSTNGTFVQPHPDANPFRLQPGVRQLIEPGALVLFGDRTFRLVGRSGA